MREPGGFTPSALETARTTISWRTWRRLPWTDARARHSELPIDGTRGRQAPDEIGVDPPSMVLLLRVDAYERRGKREVGVAVDERIAVEDDRGRRGRRALLSLRAWRVDRG